MVAVKLPKCMVTWLEMGKTNLIRVCLSTINLIQIWKTHENPKISVFLNLIPRNIRIVSNFFFARPKNIISDKYLTQKYHFG